jgi:flavin-dependent dehydrogenase
LILTGDAFAFLDPVFSSGVFLALYSGEMGANFADACLTDQNFDAERFVAYGKDLCKSIESMRALVYAFYDHNFSFRAFLKEFPKMKGDVTDCLIGNLLHDFEPMYQGMAKHAKLPEPLKHGAPLLQEEAVSVQG